MANPEISQLGIKKMIQEDERGQYNSGNMSGWALTMPEDFNNNHNVDQTNNSSFYGIEG